MNYTVVIDVAVWGGALAYYFLDARKWFQGPVHTVETLDSGDASIENIVIEPFKK